MTDTLDEAPATLDEILRSPTQDGPDVRLYLVDGSGFIFRAYHVLPPLTRKSDGLPVGAVQGFCNMLWKLLVDMKAAPDAPTHLAVVFDHSEKTFRNDLYPHYKAHRPPAPEDLVPQFPLVREATRAFGVPCLEQPGYEADDLIAAYCCQVRDAGGEVVIVSSDKGPDAAGRRPGVDAGHHEEHPHRPGRGVREVRRGPGEGGRCPGPLRGFGGQCAGGRRSKPLRRPCSTEQEARYFGLGNACQFSSNLRHRAQTSRCSARPEYSFTITPALGLLGAPERDA